MSFRSRIITTFLLFAIMLTAAFGLLLETFMNFVGDEIIRDFLSDNMSYFEAKVQSQVTKNVLIKTAKVKGYLTRFNGVPAELEPLNDGFHDKEYHHILVKTLGTGYYAGEKLILVFDESKSFLDKNENAIAISIVLFSFVIVALAAVVCIYLAKSIASPIEYLAQRVGMEQGGISDSSVLSRNDELGSLARAFSLSVERIQHLLEREKNFTRYASHELRTPLTVVKNNIDILRIVTARSKTEQLEQDSKVTKTYENSMVRLEQALWFMEQQINTLLLLARGEYQANFIEVALSPLLSDVEAYFPDLNISKHFNKELSIWSDPTVLLSILTNTLNNVMEHGVDNHGKAVATIEANQGGFSVSNPISDATKKQAGKRFGLAIVKQLCDVMNWQLELDEKKSETGFQFSVQVIFPKS